MARAGFKVEVVDHLRDQQESVPIRIRSTSGMRRRLGALAELGIYGRDIDEVAERLICRQLQTMEAANG